MCSPAAFAITSMAGSAMQARERNLQIRAANRQQQLAYNMNVQMAQDSFSTVSAQRQAKQQQTSEAYAQRLQQLGIEGWKAAASIAVRPGQENTQGSAASLVQAAYAAEGRAASAMGRQFSMQNMSTRRNQIMDAQQVPQRIFSMWKPAQLESSPWSDAFNAGIAGLNTYNASKGLFDTTKTPNDFYEGYAEDKADLLRQRGG